MPSIFSRSRTASTPYPTSPDSPHGADEFGRVSSRQSNHKGTGGGGGLFSGTSKKDKKKAAAKEAQMARLRTVSGVASPGPSINSPTDVGDGFGATETGVFEYAGIFVQDGAFFPTLLEKPNFDTSNGANHALDRSFNSSYSSTLSASSVSSISSTGNSTMDFPYLSYQRHVVLSIDDVSRLVEVVCAELGTRGGITTPFIFSTLALDISPTRIRRLIDCFLATCSSTYLYSQRSAKEKSMAEKEYAEQKWREEARFAGMHELGMLLRWALARVVRVSGGQECRGLVSYEWYSQWRDEEEALLYPPTHFTALLPSLAASVRDILLTILSLLARLTANSATSGHTPPTLSPLFGPLLFGLGPPSLPFHHTYVYYLRSVNALEHILLAFVRWQDTPRSAANSPNLLGEGSQTTLGVPKKLKEWIKGYPATLPHLDSNLKRRQEGARPEPRKGARTTRVLSVKRNVRSYDKDLVRNSASWSKRPGFIHGQPQASQTNVVGGLESSREWERIAPMIRKGSADRQPPKYSEAYKKRMNIPSSISPDLGVSGNTNTAVSESNFAYGLTALTPSNSSSGTKDFLGVGNLGLGGGVGEDRFKSLTDLKWGEFESLGFGGLGSGGEGDKKLEFDLTEGARTARSKKRQTLGWDDFSSSGFSRGDDPLKATLQFSAPLTATIESWPKEREEISKKLKKREKALPAFGWDTSPVIGSEEVIEEAFMDVFCDLIWGSGWGEGLAGLSGLRDEGVTAKDGLKVQLEDRECNWAMVEFKSLPTSRSQLSSRPAHYPKPVENDARTADTLILFEEFVPLEYRQQLATLVSGNRKRLPSLFSPKKSQWKQAATLNGKPYVVGHVPTGGPNLREMEFEGLLRGDASGETRLLSLSTSVKAPKSTPAFDRSTPVPQQPPQLQIVDRPTSASEDMHSDSTLQSATQGTPKRRFGLPSSPAVGVRNRAAGLPPAEYSTVDFQTRLRGYSDDSNSIGGSSLDEYGGPDEDDEKRKKRERRESRRPPEEAWVDILVGTQERRMTGQDAVMRSKDPEAASMEVAQALAAVQSHRREFSPSDDEEDMAEKEKEMKRVLHEHRPYGDFDEDEDLSEIETVPRRERPRESYTSTVDYTDDSNGDAYGVDDYPEEDEEPKEPPKKKLGYFDLHPERRPPSMLEDDPRTRAMQKYNDSDDEGEDAAFATPAAPTPALAAAPTTPQGHVRPLPTVPAPASPPKSAPSPISQPAPKPLPSKTASLIEMYREKEKGALAPGAGGAPNAPSVGPSKIPVRTGGKSELPSPPSAPSPPQKEPSPPLLTEPPKLVEDTGRASPARYVHGAPLHNVQEEEEEEE